MKFQGKTEEQLNEERLIPDGTICDFEVVEAKDTKSKKGNDMIELTKIKVYHGDSFRFVMDWLLEAMPHKLLHFCQTTDLTKEYERGTLCAQDCIGRGGKVRMTVEEQDGYEPRNKVKDYIGTKEAEKIKAKKATPSVNRTSPATAQPSDISPELDDVPF